MTDERFDYQRQADDDEQQQDAAPQMAHSVRTADDDSNIARTSAELAPDAYWLSEMKRLAAYNEAWDKWNHSQNAAPQANPPMSGSSPSAQPAAAAPVKHNGEL